MLKNNKEIEQLIIEKKYDLLEKYLHSLVNQFKNHSNDIASLREGSKVYDYFLKLLHNLIEKAVENNDFRLLKLPLYYNNERLHFEVLKLSPIVLNKITHYQSHVLIDKLILSNLCSLSEILNIVMTENNIPIIQYIVNHDAINIASNATHYENALIKKDINAFKQITNLLIETDNLNFSHDKNAVLIAMQIGFTDAIELIKNFEEINEISYVIADINYKNPDLFHDILTYTQDYTQITQNVISLTQWLGQKKNDDEYTLMLQDFSEKEFLLTLIKAICKSEEFLELEYFDYYQKNSHKMKFDFLAQVLIYEALIYLSEKNLFSNDDMNELLEFTKISHNAFSLEKIIEVAQVHHEKKHLEDNIKSIYLKASQCKI